jgi:hypothetical protein
MGRKYNQSRNVAPIADESYYVGKVGNSNKPFRGDVYQQWRPLFGRLQEFPPMMLIFD